MRLALRPAPLDSCPLCGSQWGGSLQTVARAADVSGLIGRELEIKRCSCGLSFTSPIPTEDTSGALYQGRDSSNFDSDGGGVVAVAKNYLARRFLRHVAHSGCRSILDYSTGNGRYANAAAQVFPEATVVASDIMDTAPSGLAQSVTYLTNERVGSSGQHFDFIILRHVLEHSYNPSELLRTLAALLSDQGVLYVEVPNLNCSWRSLAGAHWPGFYAPYHVWQFTGDSLSRAVATAGLSGSVAQVSMPMMGNIISRRLKLRETLSLKAVGVALYPIQWVAEKLGGNASAMSVTARRAKV